MSTFSIGPYDRQGNRISESEYQTFRDDPAYHRVACERVGKRWMVITIWTGVIAPLFGEPSLFETTVFERCDSGESHALQLDDTDDRWAVTDNILMWGRRYATEAAAFAGHAQTVLEVRAEAGRLQ